MELTNKAEEYFFKIYNTYNGILDSYIQTLSEIYRNNPYLLIFILISIPVFVGINLKLIQFFARLVLPKVNWLQNSSIYSKITLFVLIMYFSLSIFRNSFLLLENELEYIGKFLFVFFMSTSKALMISLALKFLSINIMDQFKIVLSKEVNKKILSKNSLLLLSYLNLILIFTEYKMEFISNWIILILCIHFSIRLKSKVEMVKKIGGHLFSDISDKYGKYLYSQLILLSYIFIALTALLYKVVLYLSYFEFTKKFSAKILRHQVESISKDYEQADIPEEYRELFQSIQLKQYRPKWFSTLQNSIEEKN